jgi:ribosomal protein S18 acetylase RimI-like enzyme
VGSPADMRLWDLSPDDRSEVQALAESCEDYYLETEGRRPGPADVASILAERPAGSHEHDKHVLGVRDDDGTLAALVDVVHGWPDPETWMIGLLLVSPDHRDHGLGARLVAALAADAADAGARRLRVGVLGERAAAVRFWERQGFGVVETVDRETDSGAHELLVMVRELPIAGEPA